uniref:Uncharacterized protein n=1 Tax=Panagrolaimus superbus TaxID=310955 RepID=A0A914YN91_9BILA
MEFIKSNQYPYPPRAERIVRYFYVCCDTDPAATADKEVKNEWEVDEANKEMGHLAIKLFFEAKKSMKKHLDMSDDEITLMKEKILAYGTYMKENLGSLKTKQKGHLFDAPEFTAKFKTSSFFSDEPIEAYHPICNNREKRIKLKECPKNIC